MDITYDKNSNDTHLYYNIDIFNNEAIDQDNNPTLAYSDTRDTAILDNISDWYFSIIRFQLKGVGMLLPIFMPEIEVGQTDINKTIYKISICYNYKYNNNNYTPIVVSKNISFVPQNKNAVLPQAPISKMDKSTNYYFVHNYDHCCKMVNNTFKEIIEELQTQIRTATGNNSLIFIFKEPKIIYDVNSGLFNLYLDNRIYNRKTSPFGDTTNNNIDIRASIYFNSNMWGLFGNFHYNKVGNDIENTIEYYQDNTFTDAFKGTITNTNGVNYEIMPQDKLGTNIYTYNGISYYKMIQNFESTSELWNPISSIVFTTSILPSIGELAGNPIVFNDGKAPQQTNNNITEKIITDMTIPMSSAEDYSGCITYYPSNEYRLVDFFPANYSLRNLDIQGKVKFKDGSLYPLKMFNGGSANIKIMFRKKSFNN